MLTCDHCRDLLWDHLYDALEADEARSLRDHLVTCPECRAELAQAERQLHIIHDAARLDVAVPPFAPPADEATLPLPAWTARRDRRVGRWAGMAAAAAVLFLVCLPFALYQRGRSGYEAAVATAQERLRDVETERRQLLADARVLVAAQREAQVRLQVVGPARYHPEFASTYHVRTTDLAGKAVRAAVTARLVSGEGRVLCEVQGQERDGDVVVTLPPGLALAEGQPAELVVLAEAAGHHAEVRGSLTAVAARYVTHVALDKPLYRPGEKVFFRSLTLDRFSLRPAAEELILHYTIYDPQGKAVHQLNGLAHQGGIGGGEFVVNARAHAEGEYTLTVTDRAGRFPPQNRKFLVQHPGRIHKALRLDRETYAPGDTVQAQLRARADRGRPVANGDVTATLLVDGQPVGATAKTRTDAEGTAAFRLELPRDLPEASVRLAVTVEDAGRTERVERALHLRTGPPRLEVFPEGGELVAGVPNRVYYRLSAAPAATPLQGTLVDGEGREVARVEAAPQPGGGLLGSVVLTPRADTAYTLRLGGVAQDLPRARAVGVVLTIPDGVLDAGEPVTGVLHHAGLEGHTVLLAATCRGRLVAQRRVTLGQGPTTVALPPAPEAHGVLAVTVYDAEAPQLVPLAERLVYRDPAERLHLEARPDKEQHRPRDRVRLTVRSHDAKGEAVPAWLLVAVVDREVHERVADPLHRGPTAHFHVLADLASGADLAWSDVLLHDTPQAEAALDLYLGTVGWRRFVAPSAAAGAARSEEHPILKLDNLAQVRRDYLAAVAGLQERFETQERTLAAKEAGRADEVLAAAAALDDYDDRAARLVRLAAGLGAVVVLAAGAVFLAVGIVRTLAGMAARAPYFAAACGVAALGLVLAFGVGTGVVDPERLFGPGPLVVEHPVRPAQDVVAELEPVRHPPVPGLQPRDAGPAQVARLRLRGDVEGGKGTLPLKDSPTLLPVNQDDRPRPLPVKEYAHRLPSASTNSRSLDTLYWHPNLQTAQGSAQVQFDLPDWAATFHVRVYGHTATGRLGVLETTLEALPQPSSR